jgi:L-asparaginase
MGAAMLACVMLGGPAAAADDSPSALTVITEKPGLPTVAIITTGGTIAEQTKSGGEVPSLSGRALLDKVPGLSDLANIALLSFSDIDSSQMTPDDWARLSRATDQVLARSDIEGAVITHGTDTMAEGAYFLDLTLSSDKPVVFTGAMNDASSLDPDGPDNIMNAIIQVLSPAASKWGVTVTLNHYVNAARDVRKTQTMNVQTFTSGGRGYLGYVYERQVVAYNIRLGRQRLALPQDAKLPDVPLISMYAGEDGSLLRYAIDRGAKGVVVEGVGAGNVNAEMFKAIKLALSKDIPVVIASRVYYGAVEPVYGDKGGGKALLDAGCIMAGDLIATKARLLLMVGLMNFGNDHDKLSKLFAP